jgi:hypothetical protein
MEQVSYQQVLQLAEQLTPEEQQTLIARMQEIAAARQLSIRERKALFASMTLDLGPVAPGFSDRRADWYGDDER